MTTGRYISLAFSLVYLIIALILGGIKLMLMVGVGLIIPLGLIWFGNEIGDYIGFIRLGGPYITKKSPGDLVALFGWVFLVAPLVILLLKVL